MTEPFIKQKELGGRFKLPGTSLTVNRMGYGAMQLAGPQVWGPPRDVDGAIAVLREAVASGVNHIDTSDYYGPHVTNQLIKRALHPYPKDLVIVTKVGARRGEDKSWSHALARQELIDGIHDNLRNLGLERLEVVNLRVGGFGRTEATRINWSYRSKQYKSRATSGGSENHRNRLRAELLQRGTAEG